MTNLIEKHTLKLNDILNLKKQVWSKIKEIENRVQGTTFNPSDSDQAPGRVNFGDVKSSLGVDVANQWLRLHDAYSALNNTSRKVFKLLDKASIKAGLGEADFKIMY